ncbi:MAG: hypothetical protein A2Z71_09405 [Chloroflexi bacterium RBG_13_50_21]|nr:MAG: hypothetical protein A2Z71_09405 [Chloroflexi bacterium RBG_13_50_21]OGO60262.1 MAG: hypothetical protein A2029_14000 [Chloroflexi bacterium RBG_19FT_COMBO_47_9]
MQRTKWFWPWQDEKEEAWLEEMSTTGWHLKSVHLPCVYTFNKGEAQRIIYRLDYMPLNKAKSEEYIQIFEDAGWDYIGEMSNWRYWRKRLFSDGTPEIFTDNESKIRKYQRMLTYMVFFLVFLTLIGTNLFMNGAWREPDNLPVVNAIYLSAMLCYAVVIPIYVVVVIKLLHRISQLKKSGL